MGYFLFMLVCWLFVFIVGCIAYSILREYRDWNGGVCPHTGGSWMYQGEDESGARKYYSGAYELTVNWPYIDDYVDQ